MGTSEPANPRAEKKKLETVRGPVVETQDCEKNVVDTHSAQHQAPPLSTSPPTRREGVGITTLTWSVCVVDGDWKALEMALRIVNMVSAAVRALLDSGVEECVRGSNDLASPTALLLLPVLFMVYRKLYAGMVYRNLSSMPAGAGKQGNNWLKGDGEKSKSTSDVEVEVTWLGATELKVLQACGDTLLPGFEIGTKEAADAAVEQVGGVFVATRPPLCL